MNRERQPRHEWGSAPEFVGPRHAFREDLLLRTLLAARPRSRVLNVGAGQGTFTNRLVDAGFEVTSTDLSPAAVAVLEERARGTVVEADATKLPFADAVFDAVVLGEVIEHVEDDARALAEAHRVLVPGGVVAISVPRNPAWFSSTDEWAGHFRRYTREQLLSVVGGAGFTSIDCVAWGFPFAALYHRTAYERAVRRSGSDAPDSARRALPLLGMLLRVDRRFIGTERGALGYVLVACKHFVS